MTSNKAIRIAVLVLALLPIAFAACIKDNCNNKMTYTYFIPVYETRDKVINEIGSGPAKAVKNPGKLFILGKYIFLNDIDRGIHVIDNSNPSSPANIAFISIPGNLDISVKGNTLYADLYEDLLAIDITNPLQVVLKKVVEDVFPARQFGGGFFNANSNMVIVDWIERDTTVVGFCDNQLRMPAELFFSATSSSLNTSSSPVGTGGSMARFTIMDQRLYTVNHSNLFVFNINITEDPIKTFSHFVGNAIETIYPFKSNLFIGSANGMFIYDVTNPDMPVKTSQFTHANSCDPVIADDNYAYVTLRSGNTCAGFTNQLEVVKLNNMVNPVLQKIYPLTNPHGLSKDNNLLFICDGKDGLKLYNAADVNNLQLLKTISGMETYDVITLNKIALVSAKDGLYQFDYTDVQNIRLLSKIPISGN